VLSPRERHLHRPRARAHGGRQEAATKERKGINPFTKEPTVFKAKPARKVVKGRPVKAAKDAVA